MDSIKLTFDEDVYEYIVDKALEFKLGARGLRSIVEAIMMDAMFSSRLTRKRNSMLLWSMRRRSLKNQM